jgi:hypothetical protein
VTDQDDSPPGSASTPSGENSDMSRPLNCVDPRRFGQLPALAVPDTFDDPLPDDEIAAFGGHENDDDVD